jgi:hypothetical protein
MTRVSLHFLKMKSMPSALLLLRSLRQYAAKSPILTETGFESKWRALTEEQRDKVELEYEELALGDWRKLSFDQKRARIHHFHILTLY